MFSMLISAVLAILLPISIFLLFLKPTTALAVKTGLVDKPDLRKLHTGAIPLIGGILIFVSIFLTNLLLNFSTNSLQWFFNYFLAGGLLVLVGVLDDRYDVRATIKLLLQLALAIYAFYNGIRVESMNGIFGFYELPIIAQFCITVFGITGFVNAFNLMDGVDGLASAYALLTFSIFLALKDWSGSDQDFVFLISICASLIIFLRFNLAPKGKKIFLGDAGSLFLGYIMVLNGVQLLQTSSVANDSFNFSLVLCLLLVPLMDSVRVYLFRINRGRSPFKADRNHFHHLLVEAGVKAWKATLIIISYVLLMIIFALILINFISINILLIILGALFLIFIALLNFNLKISMWKIRLKEIEKKK